MKFKGKIISYLKNNWWYLILLSLSTIYITYYRDDIYQLEKLNAKNLIFIVWLVLLLFPLFSEMELFGLRLKREIDKAKAEVKENLNDLRMQIMELRISYSNANTINFGSDFLPNEHKLKKLIEEFITKSNSKSDNYGETSTISNIEESKGVPSDIDFEVTEESIYLFKVRLMLEKILADLCEKTNYNSNKSIHEMVRHLYRCELINCKIVDLINQIIKIANRGVHGEIVSSEYIDFIKKVLPELQKQLNEANTQLHYCNCPRCKYSGYSRFENVCPKCGFTSDEF